ncbi:MAG TPA: amidohydrolase [Gemmataceae bacterium]|jgi:hippurate hydrolase|nr:amidohydrolase [Gemmataceae bacterium]
MNATKCLAWTFSALVLLAGDTWLSADEPKPDPALHATATAVRGKIEAEYSSLEKLYKQIHSHPELSYQEEQTSARLAKEMKDLGFDVTTNIGGHGIVCILKNGTGPTVMIRTDMDALPVTEQTGRPYASKVRGRNQVGAEVGVMHACGHDMHMTCWIGTARALASMKDQWSGTLMFIGQPAEEVGAGARMMIEDGLFKRFPKPDYALALHCDSRLPAGHVSFTEGLALANVDTVDVLVKGKGGHGAAPHTTIDPIVLSAKMILDWQTIVSRELNPTDPAVVTVGSIHGGTKHNIIPNEVKMQLTVRSTKDEVRKHVLDAIKRIAKAVAEGAGAPEPEVSVNLGEFTPACLNDRKLTRRTVAVFEDLLGKDKVHERPPMMGGEDFARYGREGVPIFIWFLGTIDDKRWQESLRPGATPLPSMHADSYWPSVQPSIENGVLTMSMAVLNIVEKK